ncbi:hypothetical protein ElyMa_005934800 [Elysia marginata]|uniref:Kazal-like domain-containing protein n=1 Tax=Elysia marginata TaxID=1093978 RepID=A0AAV4GAU9_9GAST|nr:hypothetical protein ElyMa_005934800 [Elysia marginata]
MLFRSSDFYRGLLLAFLSLTWAVTVSFADECQDRCHVTCVSPPGKACTFGNLDFQKPCLLELGTCVVICSKRCHCKRQCKHLDAPVMRKAGGFDTCVERCFSEAVKTMSAMPTKKPKLVKPSASRLTRRSAYRLKSLYRPSRFHTKSFLFKSLRGKKKRSLPRLFLTGDLNHLG